MKDIRKSIVLWLKDPMGKVQTWAEGLTVHCNSIRAKILDGNITRLSNHRILVSLGFQSRIHSSNSNNLVQGKFTKRKDEKHREIIVQ